MFFRRKRSPEVLGGEAVAPAYAGPGYGGGGNEGGVAERYGDNDGYGGGGGGYGGGGGGYGGGGVGYGGGDGYGGGGGGGGGYGNGYGCRKVPKEKCVKIPNKIPRQSCHPISKPYCESKPKQVRGFLYSIA